MTERGIAKQYGLDKSSVHRHRGCISTALEKSESDSAVTARGVMLRLVAKLEKLADETEREKERSMFLLTADRLTRAADSFGRLNREITPAPVVALFADLGVSGEPELRSRLDLVRGSEHAGLDDLWTEWAECTRFLLAERPELRDAALALLSREASGAEVIEANGNGNGGPHD